MYPLHVILVGCGESIRGQVRRQLANQLVWIKAEYRDVTTALQKTKLDADELPLFIVYLRGLDDLPQLQKLSSAFPGKPILALRERNSDQQVFLGALKSGAAFAIPVPLDGDDLQTALNWIGRQFGYTPRLATVVAVAGVAGGCGASTVAVNLAHEFGATLAKHTILMELSTRLGMLASYLNVEPRFSLLNLLEDTENLDMDYFRQVLTKVNDHLELLSGPPQAIQTQGGSPADLMRIVHYARPLADVVVLDVPCTYDDTYFEALSSADRIVLVWEQKIPSVRALQMVRDALHRKHVPDERVPLVVNRYEERVKGFTLTDLEQLLHVKGLRTVANDFGNISAAQNSGQSLRSQAPGSRALADIDKLVRHLAGLREVSATDKQTSVFGRVVRAFGLN